jgi:two-component system, OmpR family, sensor kinase
MPIAFRTKITLWYTLVLSVLLVISAMVLYVTLQNAAERKLDSALWLIGSTEAEGTSTRMRDRGLTDPDDLAVRDIDIADLAGYENFRFQRYVTVVTQSFKVADFSINLASQPLPFNENYISRALTGEVIFDTVSVPDVGKLRVIYVPVLRPETKPFVVMVGVPTEFVGAELKGLVSELISIILVFLSLAAISGWFLARWTLRPVKQAAAAVHGISETNLHARLPQLETNDEIDNLIRVFNQLLSRLERSFETQKRFTADVSHEIGTPLTTLKGETEVALLENRTAEEYKRILLSNLEEIEYLSQIFNNLLVLARADVGEQQVAPEVLSIDVVMRGLFERFHPMAEASGIDYRLEIEKPVFVLGDQTAIEQIVSNLLQNALRYTVRGGAVSMRVSISGNEQVRIEISDNGIGIPEADLPHIFERFYRARNARLRRSDGSGLGLSISNLLAVSLGGTIEVKSETGVGSKFIFTMPILKYSPEA